MSSAYQLEAAVSAARTWLAYQGGSATYYVLPDNILIQYGITSIDGHPVEVLHNAPQMVTGL